MCAPVVIESVREELSRRGFLNGVGAVIAGAAVATPASAARAAETGQAREGIS